MIRAVIVDFDDTLCLTETISFEIENEALARLGRPPMPRAIHVSTWGQPLFEVIRERSPGVDPAAFRREIQTLFPEYIAAGKLDAIPEENYAALDELLAEGKQIMLLTSRTHDELKHMLEPDHGLAKRVTAFYYRDNMQFHKPDPRAFDVLLATHGLHPEECAYVGDSLTDAAAANARGLHFIANLESGLRTRDSFAEYRVDAFVDTFPGVVGAVRALDAGVQ